MRFAVLMLVCGAAACAQDDWAALGRMETGRPLRIERTNRQLVTGRFESLAGDTLTLRRSGDATQSVTRSEVRTVWARSKGSRAKSALIGGLIGFGIGFAIGAPSAGYLTDRNDPSAAHRIGIGAGLGLYGGGIGAAIGALTGGSSYPRVYRAAVR